MNIKIKKKYLKIVLIIKVMYTIDYTPYKLRDWLYSEHICKFWECLSINPNAIHLLEQNQDKIDWNNLSKNPNAIHLLEQNKDKINWSILSFNSKAIHILEQDKDYIDWYHIFLNPSIFEINYADLQKRIDPFKEELMQKCYHPKRLVFYLETYNYDIGEDEYQD